MNKATQFWCAAVAGFVVIFVLVLIGLALPRWMMGMHVDTFWMREPMMFGAMGVCAMAVASYFALMSWLDQ